MAKDYRPVDRDQQFLLPPDMRSWLPGDHLVWFVISVVEQLDMARFEARSRRGGVGRRGFDPRMLLTVLIYAYAMGERSSRQIERLCHTDVAFRIACAGDVPDHTTIARFRQRHEQALVEVFTDVLGLCARSGLGKLGTVAIDGTKIAANASEIIFFLGLILLIPLGIWVVIELFLILFATQGTYSRSANGVPLS